MELYEKLYYQLFNAITDALSSIKEQNYGTARDTLISAQQVAEEMFISSEHSDMD